MNPILELSNVRRRYRGGVDALDGIDLRVDRPQVIGLLGRNGAGKSTLLRMIPPLIHPNSGEVRVFGLDPWEHQVETKRRVGYLADEDFAPPGLRGRDLLDLCARVHARWDAALIARFVERFQLNLGMPLAALSKGQRRQVGLLAAIGHRPELLLLDEPAGNLDPVVRRELLGAVVELLAESGTTVILATHLFADIERLAERVVILHRGRVLIDDQLERLREQACVVELPADAAVRERLERSPLCLRVRGQAGTLRAALRCAPDRASDRLREDVGAAAPTAVQGVTLEELFIEATGDAP
jgi:ABC-2 type transport system ATP-binding protein